MAKYKVGDKVGWLILGEIEETVIKEVIKGHHNTHYMTDKGILGESKIKSIKELQPLAKKRRKKFTTLSPANLMDRVTVEYENGRWAQIGIINNCLYWKLGSTYEFLDEYQHGEDLIRAYNRYKELILNIEPCKECEEEHSMSRLYKYKDGYYASAEYVVNYYARKGIKEKDIC